MTVRSQLALIAGLALPCMAQPGAGSAARVAQVDLRIGADADDREAFVFADVRGLVADRNGRIFVADTKDDNIRVFSRTGEFLFAFGRRGQGPAEFQQVCCLAFDGKGRLWAKDFGNRRYHVFAVDERSARVLWTVRGHTNPAGYLDRIGFVDDARPIDLGVTMPTRQGTFRLVRVRIDSAGAIRATDTVPEAAAVEPRPFVVERDGGVSTFAQPMGPRQIYAFGPRGVFLSANTGRYHVDWYDAAGVKLRTITRTHVPVPLSDIERRRARETLEAIARRQGMPLDDLPFGVPAVKPALDGMGFDLDGRVWIRRSVPEGQPRVADVYGADGRPVGVFEWPANIRLELMAISGDIGFGIQLSEDRVPTVVRVVFR